MVNTLKSWVMPLVCVGSAVGVAAAWEPWGALAAVPLGVLALWTGHSSWEKQREQALEDKALETFRSLEGPEITRDVLVRHYDLSPREAEAVLTWLLRHQLVEAEWDEEDVQNPIVYRASERAIPAPPQPDTLEGASLEGGGSQSLPLLGRSPYFGAPYGPKNPGTAAILSMFMPGLGQLYAGNAGRAKKIFLGFFGMTAGLGVLSSMLMLGGVLGGPLQVPVFTLESFGDLLPHLLVMGLFGMFVPLGHLWQVSDAVDTAREANARWNKLQLRRLSATSVREPADDSDKPAPEET